MEEIRSSQDRMLAKEEVLENKKSSEAPPPPRGNKCEKIKSERSGCSCPSI